MIITCREIKVSSLKELNHLYASNALRPGDMWYCGWKIVENIDPELSNQYKKDHISKRPPIQVMLENGHAVNIDCRYTNNANFDGWKVTGEIPFITVSPSIKSGDDNQLGGWHGWLNNGILSDDLAGRNYDWRW